MDNRKESRKRLRPWLERMIENSRCPGLVWENKDERTFRIPWRHFNNKDWDAMDSQIFMEWAKYTGRYHDGDKVEYPVWKTRLRCALKKIPEILELPDRHHLEDINPYRVYQFVDVPVMKKVSDFDSDYSASPGSTSFFTNSPNVRDFLEESETPPPAKYYGDSFLGATPVSNVPTVVYDEDPFHYNNLTFKTEGSPYSDNSAGVSREAMNHQLVLQDQQYGGDCAGFGAFNISSGSNFFNQMTSASLNLSDFISTSHEVYRHEVPGGAAGTQHDHIKARFPSDLMSLDSADLCSPGSNGIPSFGEPSLTAPEGCKNGHSVMQFTLKYGFPHISVSEKTVAANGCRLFFGEQQLSNTILDEDMFGPKTVTQIEMPDVKEFPDICGTQTGFISELLDSMERGLVLTYKDGDIYVKRLCRTRVFVSDGVTESKLLNRKEKTPMKVFDFAAFKTSIQHYDATNNSIMPKNHFYLTFGQEIKKNRSEPMGKVLIHVRVVHTAAAEYTSKFSMQEGTHSLLPLLISSSLDTNDRLLQGFKNMGIK